MSPYVTLEIQYCPSFLFTNTRVLTRSRKLGCAGAIMILKLKQINNPGDSCRIMVSRTAGLPLILPPNVGATLLTRHQMSCGCGGKQHKGSSARIHSQEPLISQLTGYFGLFSYEFDSSRGSMWAFEGNPSLPFIQFLLYSD